MTKKSAKKKIYRAYQVMVGDLKGKKLTLINLIVKGEIVGAVSEGHKHIVMWRE